MTGEMVSGDELFWMVRAFSGDALTSTMRMRALGDMLEFSPIRGSSDLRVLVSLGRRTRGFKCSLSFVGETDEHRWRVAGLLCRIMSVVLTRNPEGLTFEETPGLSADQLHMISEVEEGQVKLTCSAWPLAIMLEERQRPQRAWAAQCPVSMAVQEESVRWQLALSWASYIYSPSSLRKRVLEGSIADVCLALLAVMLSTGENVIAITPELQAALERTDPPDEVKAPYPAVAIDLSTPVDGAEVLLVFQGDGESGIVALPPGWPLVDCFDGTPAQQALARNMFAFLELGQSERETNKRERDLLLKQAERRKGRKAEKAQARARRMPVVTTIRIGGSYRAPQEGSGDEDSRREHWVRGHWRNQPYGPRGRRRIRRKWINPHIRCRGSEAGKIEGHTYLA